MKAKIYVTNIKWDAPKSADLPSNVTLEVNNLNSYLLDDIEGYADEVCDWLSDNYGWYIYCFNIDYEIYEEDDNG